MIFRLTTWLASARKQLGASASLTFQFGLAGLLLSLICGPNLGCASRRGLLQTCLDRSAAKMSFVSWNLRSLVTEPRESTQSRAFRIASLSNRELYHLMETRPAPDLATISGKWNGINKGVGSAMMGLMQDVKVLEGQDCVTGYNILVKQVSISDLPCRGWRPERDPKTCQPKTMGNFIAVAPNCCGTLGHTVKLDYTIAENPWYDPSRFLIDELVAIDEDILLGRATANIGKLHIPVAYFVLTRAPQCNCHIVADSPQPTSLQPSSLQPTASQPPAPQPTAPQVAVDTEHSVIDPNPNREVVNREIMPDTGNSTSDIPAAPAPTTAEPAPEVPKPAESTNLKDDESSASDKPAVAEPSAEIKIE